jgi:GT2 family glycosyltransferase
MPARTEPDPPIPAISDGDLPDIAIGILSYNRVDQVLRSLELFIAVDYPAAKLHLIVVDNGSSDGTAERVRALYEGRVEVLETGRNLGVIARNEVMLRRAERYLFYFDEDCAPADPWTIRRAVEIMEAHSWIGALCLRSINQHTGATEFGDFRQIARRTIGAWGYEGLSVIGNGMCFRGEMIRRTRGYDPRIFWGGEELQLTLELLYHEIPIVYAPDLALIHRHAPRLATRAEASEMFTRNHVVTFFSFFSIPLASFLVALEVGRNLLAALVRRRGSGSMAVLRGLRRGLAALPEVLGDRRIIPLSRIAPYHRWLISSLSMTPQSPPEPADADRIARSLAPTTGPERQTADHPA